MADLVVLGFPAESAAQVAMSQLDLLRNEGALVLEDLALITRREDGRIHVAHARHPARKGAAGGAVAGVVVGALAAIPVFGLTVGAAAGAALAKAGAIGVDERLVEQMAGELSPGAAHVLMMVESGDAGTVTERMRPYAPELVVSTLPEELTRELFTGPSSGR
ncbi:hypothetical protein Afil01_09110 [Actinorhabdospora filicis]|uniref:DUF1269 domain-containing protein n=1 Tax=Actinorhabdospora filicis TaxID=1785913 RepID=A0A9W6SIH1_9ACTN|nr:DUF1269 domain-containing protein [Actinorhabdospora filicis]GLZ76104.1 hypothetical protein Afil01_09110 [Actinorhabdospora filicis]